MSESATPTFVVGIGASAGGLKPIESFFDHMPTDSGMAFVVVQHLSPDFKSLMDQLLARHTKMAIYKVNDGVVVEPNSIYLIPPEKNMALSNGKLLLTDKAEQRGLNLPIDIFFQSLAKDAGNRAVGIVLSGTGSDGSRGIKDIHESEGLVLVQSLDSVDFDGMPRAAIDTGVVDLICPPEAMPKQIVSYSSTKDRRALQQSEFKDSGSGDEAALEPAILRIFRLFRQNFNLDFSLYKPATITRRIERRMKMRAISDIDEYVDALEKDVDEIDGLFRDLLVEVTHFFRDRDAFQLMREDVIPGLLERVDASNEIRVWVCGCATGEEAYSIAILLAEAIDKAERSQKFKVFATDVHRKSLEIASAGFYPSHALDSVPADLQHYFVRNNGICNVRQEIRRNVIFAANDLTRDPPFTRMDLISCRNVLIYLEPKVQQRVLSMFHFGLRVGGVMFLGPSESVGDLSSEFDSVDRHWRIYSKRRDVRLPNSPRLSHTAVPVLGSVIHEHSPALLTQTTNSSNQSWLALAYEELLAKHVPPSLLVDEFYDLVHCFGTARKLLSPPEGKPSNNILKMLEQELSVAVSSAIHRAKQENIPVTYKGIRVKVDQAESLLYRVTVEPYRKTDRSLFLISLEETEKVSPTEEVVEDFRADQQSGQRIGQLERELSYTRETLQATVEELESSNEELQATNEELIASNEELQSTNEELHSVNEELFTVNTEHKEKIEELTELSSDMDNLLRNTEIGTIFLDRNFTIRRFTPSISAGFNVIDQDVGRPIEHIASKLDYADLMIDAATVLETGSRMEAEVNGVNGGIFLLRIQPYKVESRIGGIVLTLTDITEMKEAEKARSTMQTLTEISQELPDFAYAVSHDLQAPLRHIAQYTQILERAIESKKEEQISKAARVIKNSSNSLRTMIDGLLAYSRINTQGKSQNRVSMNTIIQSSILELKTAIDALNATVVVSPDFPDVVGDSAQLKDLFFHLIDNSLKFNSDDDPIINISFEAGDGNIEIEVSDNGIGVDPSNDENVFTIFRRLGMKDDVPGAGVGLAICRRIVLRHNGRIRLKKSPSGGTTVVFDLKTAPTLVKDQHLSNKLQE